MAHDSFDYPRMIALALRDVARQALMETAEHGLPGEHHFYLSFRTRGEGVQVPGFLRDQYPDEMTIVLQNQYWDLVVDDAAFSVSLTFNGSRHRIIVPFPELTAFADPSAQLGLRFEPPPGEEGEEGGETDAAAGEGSPFGNAGGSPFTASGNSAAAAGGDDGADAGDGDGESGAEVVHLDRFRRRSEGGEEEAAPEEETQEGSAEDGAAEDGELEDGAAEDGEPEGRGPKAT